MWQGNRDKDKETWNDQQDDKDNDINIDGAIY